MGLFLFFIVYANNTCSVMNKYFKIRRENSNGQSERIFEEEQ